MSEKLRACPFCGSVDTFYEEGEASEHWIGCHDCLMEGPVSDTEDEAVTAWNRRDTSEVDRLTKERDAYLQVAVAGISMVGFLDRTQLGFGTLISLCAEFRSGTMKPPTKLIEAVRKAAGLDQETTA